MKPFAPLRKISGSFSSGKEGCESMNVTRQHLEHSDVITLHRGEMQERFISARRNGSDEL